MILLPRLQWLSERQARWPARSGPGDIAKETPMKAGVVRYVYSFLQFSLTVGIATVIGMALWLLPLWATLFGAAVLVGLGVWAGAQ